MSVWQRVMAWFIGDDPAPEYSRLDLEDGLVRARAEAWFEGADAACVVYRDQKGRGDLKNPYLEPTPNDAEKR